MSQGSRPHPQPMWAPWRMEYILGQKPHVCIFCEMFRAPSSDYPERLVLALSPDALVCLNKYPFASGHLLVVPRRHVADLQSLEDGEYQALMSLLRAAVARLGRALGPHGVNVGFNLGQAAGAGIADHVHAHIVPRWDGDCNFMPVIGDVRVMPEYLDATWRRLMPQFADLSTPSVADVGASKGSRRESPPGAALEAPEAEEKAR